MPLVWVIDNHLHNDVLGIWGNVRDQLLDSYEFLGLEVKLHVCCMPRKKYKIRLITILFEVLKQFLIWCTHDVVNLVDLVELIITWEEWEQREDLKEYRASSPNVHLSFP